MTTTKFSFLTRLPALGHDAFSSYWHGPHVRALVDQGGHRDYNQTYVQNVIVECHLGRADWQFDGVAQMEVREGLPPDRRFQQDPRYMQSVRPDEQKFLDVGRCIVAYCDSEVITAAPDSARFKLLLMHMGDLAIVQGEIPDAISHVDERSRIGIKHHAVDRSKLTQMSDGSPMQWPYTAITEFTAASEGFAREVLHGVEAWLAKRGEAANRIGTLHYMTAVERVIY